MATCEEGCDHLFEAATLSALLGAAQTERDRLREALGRAGATDGLECGCGMYMKDCDKLPVDEPPRSSYFCAGRIARAALTPSPRDGK